MTSLFLQPVLRKMSTHTFFQVDGETLSLKVGVRSWGDAFRGIYVAELYRGEQLNQRPR